MKKLPFYHPASPFFFHITVLLLYILIFLLVLLFSEFLPYIYIFAPFIFSAVYPFFALLMSILVRRAYLNTYQAIIPEEFADKLTLYNRYLITVIYVFFPLLTLFSGLDYPQWVALLILIATGPLFLFCIFVLPVLIRLTLLNKMRSIHWAIIIVIFSLLFLTNLFIIWRL